MATQKGKLFFMRLTPFLFLSFLSNVSVAQIPDALLEACNAVPDSVRRLECLRQATTRVGSSATPLTLVSHDALRRNLIGLQGSLDTGVNLVNYLAAVNEIARELAIFEREAPKSDSLALLKLREALDTYADAGKFWKEDSSFFAVRSNSNAYFGGLPMRLVGLEWMIDKHALQTRNADLFGIFRGVPAQTGRTTMWTKAKALADEGLLYLRDPTAADTANETLTAKDTRPQTTIFGITVKPSVNGGMQVTQLEDDAPTNIQIGDVILTINGVKPILLIDFRTSISEKQQPNSEIELILIRDRIQRYVGITVKN